jgi:hypothetical protein
VSAIETSIPTTDARADFMTPDPPPSAPVKTRKNGSSATPTSEARPSRLQAAYAEAKKQHSDAPQVTEPVADPPARTEPAETDITPSQSKAPEPDATTPAQEPTFLSDEEFAALQTEQNDPIAFRKALDKRFNKALTQGTQKLSALRKALEPHVDLLDGLESDPQATIRALAKQHNVSLGEATAQTKPAETSANALTIAKEALGPELDFLADKIAPAIQRIIAQELGTSVEPLKARLQEQDQRTAREEVDSSVKAFEGKYPSWKQHEDRMTELAQSFPPNGNVSVSDWMESLYKLATYDTAIAAGQAQAIQRMTKAAKTSDTSRPVVHESHVRPVMPAKPSFRDAYKAAKDGVIW